MRKLCFPYHFGIYWQGLFCFCFVLPNDVCCDDVVSVVRRSSRHRVVDVADEGWLDFVVARPRIQVRVLTVVGRVRNRAIEAGNCVNWRWNCGFDARRVSSLKLQWEIKNFWTKNQRLRAEQNNCKLCINCLQTKVKMFN